MTKTLELDLPADYKPSDGEIDNVVYLTCKYTAQWGMRACDKAVCLMMATTDGPLVGPAGIDKLVTTTCEYVWDHICGEPDEVTADGFFDHMKPMLQAWYKQTTPAERADVK